MPAVCPGHGHAAIAQRIADGIIGDALAVVGGQQVPPHRVGIAVGYGFGSRPQRAGGVGVFLPGGDVATTVVGVGDALVFHHAVHPGQLAQAVVGVGFLQRSVQGHGFDVAHAVVGVGEAADQRVAHPGNQRRGAAVGTRQVGVGGGNAAVDRPLGLAAQIVVGVGQAAGAVDGHRRHHILHGASISLSIRKLRGCLQTTAK